VNFIVLVVAVMVVTAAANWYAFFLNIDRRADAHRYFWKACTYSVLAYLTIAIYRGH